MTILVDPIDNLLSEPSTGRLLVKVIVRGVSYVTTIACLWQATGRPLGLETTIVSVNRQLTKRTYSFLFDSKRDQLRDHHYDSSPLNFQVAISSSYIRSQAALTFGEIFAGTFL